MIPAYEGMEVYKLVRLFFDGNEKKARAWMEAPNPLLGGIPPVYMVKMGRGAKLLRWVKQSIRDNEPPPSERKKGRKK
jgi:uncharacterized protein (DUF2384 family)